MNRQRMHTDGTPLPRGQFPERANVQLFAEIELASPFIKFFHDDLAFFSVLLAVLVLTFLVAIPDALAPVALLESVAFLSARRAHLCRDLILALVIFGSIILSLPRFAERHIAELVSSSGPPLLFRRLWLMPWP